MRARVPDTTGFVERDGVKVAYEVHGEGDPTILLIPPSPITHSRCWKGQIHHLAQRHRVITFDGRGNGRSDRPDMPGAYRPEEYVADMEAILDQNEVSNTLLVSHCHAAVWAFKLAIAQPERVNGLVAISPGVPGLGDPNLNMVEVGKRWDDDPVDPSGFGMCNPSYWKGGGYGDWVRFWFDHLAVEPHSSKQAEDMVEWAEETGWETMVSSLEEVPPKLTREAAIELCERLDHPVLVLHGTEDRCQMPTRGEEVATFTGGRLVMMEGVGHLAPGREPVQVNGHLDSFIEEIEPTPQPRTWTRGLNRRPKALYVSSPIGLGHARRDVAIANELQQLHPDLAIDWLAQHPVTTVLEAEDHSIHPASRWLASESAHIADEASGHDLNAFQALRRMDEILVANFMVFQEVVEEGNYDLVIADEAWDIDHFWHENPELKQGSQVWMTDFVGFVPMPDGGEHEAYLTADYNAEMVEHVARFPRIRDRSVFVGNVEDVVPDPLGPDLPTISEWTTEHFTFPGYVTGFVPPTPDKTAELREEFGYGDDEKVCLVTVGGSGVGRALLERVIAAYPYAHDAMPELRMIVVTGPRLDPESLDVPEGVETVGYINRLYRNLSVCDLAVVQGGLTTTMELAAARRPFLYFPLRNHFEQNRHVRYRLDRYGAGRYMDFDSSGPEEIAAAMTEEMERTIDYLPVETDGAQRTAQLISELI